MFFFSYVFIVNYLKCIKENNFIFFVTKINQLLVEISNISKI